MKKILSSIIIIFLIGTLAWGDEGPFYIAFVFDVSGSMRKHGFNRAKEELVEYLRSLPEGTHFWIIPFSENEIEAFEGELTKTNRDAVLKEAESFIEGLEAGGKKGYSYGFFTNIDEGVDAGKLAVLQQPGPGRRSVVLISDGISEPDAYHRPVDVQKLAKKIPDSVHLYLIDLAGDGGQLPASWKTSIGSVKGFQAPQSTVVLIPVAADNLKEMLSQLPVAKKAPTKPKERQKPKVVSEAKPKPTVLSEAKPPQPKVEPEPFPWRQLLPWILVFLAAIGAIYLIFITAQKVKERRHQMEKLRREKEAIVKRRTSRKVNQTLTLSIAGTAQRKHFPLKPSTSIRFGTQDGVDLPLIDPDKGHIDGQIKVNENGKILLVNGTSTFPFIVNEKVEVARGQQYPLPDKATVQVSKRVALDIRKEIVPETTAVGSIDDLIKQYRQPKEVIE